MHPNLQSMTDKQFLMRGKLISHIIFLERCIDEYIVKYFCNEEEKRLELMRVIISTKKITLDSKKEVLLYLIKNYAPELKKEYPTLNADLTDIIEERNRLAHYVLSATKEEIENYDGVVRLANFKNDIEIVLYDDDRINKLDDKVQKYIAVIHKLVNS